MQNPGAVPRRERGFTLIEMLIVVAIIAVLVAVSIPLVNNSLERTRIATDMANERAARAAATIMYLDGQMTDNNGGIGGGSGGGGSTDMYLYDAENGAIVESKDAFDISPYGKCKDHKDGYLWLIIEENGDIKMNWVAENPIPHFEGRDFLGSQ